MSDLTIYEELARMTRAGLSGALATVVDSSGSSPRKAGAKMLFRGDGTTLGTVGGGRIELEVSAAAAEAIRTRQPRTLAFTLREEFGFACGGSVSVYIEPLATRSRLVIFGAGHVGKALSSLAKGCGFHVTVVDGRQEYASLAALPDADDVVCGHPPTALQELAIDSESFIVIATTGHELDFAVVRGALATPAGFIGLLGSARKKSLLHTTLAGEGFSSKDISRIITPVGLPIGAETPAEIAVSIIGELIRIRRERNGAENRGTAAGSREFATDGTLQATAPGR